MSEPFSITVTMDDPAWDSPWFEQALAHELSEVAKLFRAERDRRLDGKPAPPIPPFWGSVGQVESEVFWQDIGRPVDAHLGGVGGE